MSERILITGAGGYIGGKLARRLGRDKSILGLDIRTPADAPCAMVERDIRDPGLGALLREEGITHVVHLASVLESSGDRERDFDIDVNGTRNLLEACVGCGVSHITVASSGAAYGYHPDSPVWIDEDTPLRGNPEFPYADHKRRVEEMLAAFRDSHPDLRQLIFRPGTVLGDNTDNQITALFAKKRLPAVRGSDSPFVFIWDEDVAAAMEKGIRESATGIYNLAGDGALTIDELAAILGKPVLRLPASVLRAALRTGRLLGVSRYGPEQVNFLRYRPVLDNTRLKTLFGYQPTKTSAETFLYYVEQARRRGRL